jgi:hypothetical protein
MRSFKVGLRICMTRHNVVWDADVESDFIDQWISGDSNARSL